MFFAGDGSPETASARAPFITDGSSGGTVKLANVAMDLTGFHILGNTAIFTAAGISPATSYELWITDGTPAHTTPLRLSTLPAATGGPVGTDVLNNKLFLASGTSPAFTAGTPGPLVSLHAPIGTAAPNTFTSVTLPCFAAGTRIRTVTGEVAVEDLRAGDRVVGSFGGKVEVKWIGYRHVRADRHRDPRAVWPIRIAAGALGDGMPARDLFLSPEHALYLDGHLVPAQLLVNGRTITRERRSAVTYFHVELPEHDVILAEGAPSESYLDTGNRSDFENAGPVIAAHPMFGADADAIWQARACAPQCRQGPRLAAIRAEIDARASAVGQRRAMRIPNR